MEIYRMCVLGQIKRGGTAIAGALLASLCCFCATAPIAGGGYQNAPATAPDTPPAQNEEAPAPEPQGPPRKVAVFMKGTEPRELKGAYSVLSSRLVAAMADSKAYTAVDRTEDVKEILEKEIAYQMSGAVADDDIRKAGMQLGVQYVCIAAVSEVMGSYQIEARLVDVESAEVVKLASKQGAVRNADQLMEAIENTVRAFMDSRNK
jgi:TolB-like protein